MSKVYLLKLDGLSLTEAGNKISEKFLSGVFNTGDNVAIKLHFGERKSNTYLDPGFIRPIYNSLHGRVANIALVDCTVLYKGDRSFGASHKKVALDNGFGFAPILIADGEKGNDELDIDIGKKHFNRVKIGAGIKQFDSILAVSHFTGHSSAGIGGALKNVGMGLGSKRGKLEMHQAFKLDIDSNICQACGKCIEECPVDAMFLEDDTSNINYRKCIGCGHCIAVCPVNAVNIPWQAGSSKELQERIAEYAYGVLKNRKSFFVNVLVNITPRCDCVNERQEPIIDDIGILASEDIVAIDQASLDLGGKENFEKSTIDPSVQINYAQQLGLGKRDYELVEI